ncbi:MAG: PAS domain S-box protein [Thermodesulfobacteriota bacterium]
MEKTIHTGSSGKERGPGRIKIGQACGLLSACIGFAALLGWIAGIPLLHTFGTGMIPMAPSTALFFMVYGAAAVVLDRLQPGGPLRRVGKVVVSLCTLASLLLFASSFIGIHPSVEHLGIRIDGTVNGAPIGHMSPLTASCLVLAGVSFLASLSSSSVGPWRATVSLVFACIVLLTGFALVIAYLLGAPLLYGSGVIPPALSTALAFLLLGMALLLLPAQQTWLNGVFLDPAGRRSAYVLAMVFTAVAAGIVTMGYLYYRNYGRHHRIEMERQLMAVADLKVRELLQWRAERLGDASVFHRNENFSGLVKRYFNTPQDEDARGRLQTWIRKVKDAYGYDRVFLLDELGIERASAPETTEPAPSHILERLPEIRRSGRIVFLDFHRHQADQAIHLGILVPILDEKDKGRPLGLLVLRIDPAVYLYPFIQRWPTPSRTAETLLVRRDGNDALFLNELRFQKNTALTLRSSLEGVQMPAVRAVLGHEGIVEGFDYRGVPVIACVRPVKDSPWFLVARMDRSEVYAPLREKLWESLVFIGVLLLAAGAVLGLVWRRQQASFYRERYEAAEALRESEERYRRTLDNMMEGCQIIGPDWRYVYVNDSAARHGRQAKDDLLGHTMMERYPGIERTGMFAVLRRCMEERTAQIIENEFTYPDGATSWFEMSVQPVPEGIFILSLDISDRKKAEDREKHLNAVLRAIRGVNQLIVREKDPYRLIQDACRNLVETRGFQSAWLALMDGSGSFAGAAEAGLGERFAPLRARLDRADLPRCARKALSRTRLVIVGDAPTECPECPLASLHGDQAALCMRLQHQEKVFGFLTASMPSAFALDEEEQGLFLEVGDDIAFALHNLQVEAAQQQSAAMLRSIFDNAADGILLAEAESHRFVSGNKAICSMLGYSMDEVKNLSVEDIHPVEDLPRVIAEFERQMKGEIALARDVPVKRKDGSVFFADVHSSPIELDGRSHMLGVFRDITERKQADEERAKLQVQLLQARKLEAVGKLTGGIAHDFNNLLTPIIGNADMALSDMSRDNPLYEAIEEIRNAGARAASLTRQLLAFSRKQILQPEILDLNQVLRDMEKMLRRIIGEDIQLETVLSPDLGPVEADVGQMEQVLMNLVVNARDAMPKGGKLTLETKNVELDESYAANHVAVTPGCYVMLAVSDTGVGMSKDVQDRLFEPFFTTKEKGKGTGLGLSTVYGIVKQSKGNIWVYSEPGQGSTFKVYLPRVTEAARTAERPGKEESLQGSGTVLVVEDDEMVRKLAQKALTKYGYAVLCARGGEEAKRMCREHGEQIRLMVTDVVMPGMSGKELAEELQRIQPGVKVLFMSGYTDNAIVHHGVLDRGVAFLQKPFTPDDLARKVREVLGD